jgi:hypothetical protein
VYTTQLDALLSHAAMLLAGILCQNCSQDIWSLY